MRSFHSFKALFTFSLFSSTVLSVGPPSWPFTITGILDTITVTNATAYNSGGTITVNGHTIIIPDNLIVQFPAKWVNFRDTATGNGDFTGNEVTVTGNYFPGPNNTPRHIAAQMQIAQTLLNFGAGYIESLSPDGAIKLVNGPIIRANDPNAVYSQGYTLHPFFTADDENPSVIAFSGYPMCVPRGNADADCPATNRPNNGPRIFRPNNVRKMVPFAPGDYLEFAGIRVGPEYICYAITAVNLQVTTDHTQNDPVYIRMEDAIIGVFDPLDPNSEFADTRFIGYVTDTAFANPTLQNSQNLALTVSRIVVDPCTGNESDELVGSAQARPGDARLKFIWRTDSRTVTKYSREYRIQVSTGTEEVAVTNTHNLTVGQFVMPVSEWVFPELNVMGVDPRPINFNGFTHLANGFFLDGDQYGQLVPFPGPAPTPVKTCVATSISTRTPSASISGTLNVHPGALVTLTGVNTNNNISPSQLTFQWSFTGSILTKISGATTNQVSFQIPSTVSSTTQVTLKICNNAPTPDCSTKTVTVKGDPALPDIVTVDSFTWTTTQGGTISVTAHSNVVDGSVTSMTLDITSAAGVTSGLSMVNQGGGKFSYNSRRVKKPTSVIVNSNLQGQSSSTTLTARKRSIWQA